MGFAPTEEQQLILDAFSRGEELVIQAAAGAGKTSSLKLLAESAPNKKFLYVAFKSAIEVAVLKNFSLFLLFWDIRDLSESLKTFKFFSKTDLMA